MAIIWNPQSYRIVRLEVRDSTGDLVSKIVSFYSVMLGYTPGYMECIHPVCSHSDVIHQIFSFSVTRSDTKSDFVSITAPPVGIYEVTVFGEDNGESEIRNFNESAMFITKQG